MEDQPRWERDGRDWPNREASDFLSAGGLRWHVQRMGAGPLVLLLHGTGATTHSWRDFAPILAKDFTLVAPDLPGHGFTGAPAYERMSLPGMAEAVGDLVKVLGVSPELVIGHSAGAAILIWACLEGRISPRAIVSINGALMPWRGIPGHIFSPAAKMLAGSAFVSRLFAWRAGNRREIERLMESTGSSLDPLGVDLYQRMIRFPSHVRATLSMMANWDLTLIQDGLTRLQTPLYLVVGEGDMTVSPREAKRVRELLPSAKILSLPGKGHLAHEEAPQEVAGVILQIASDLGLMNAESA